MAQTVCRSACRPATPPSLVYEAFGETKMNQNHKVGKLILADGTVLEGYLLF